MNNNTKWKQDGITIAGGHEYGSELNQLAAPEGIHVDDHNQTIYIADFGNYRIVEWKSDAKDGQVVARENGEENRVNPLDRPTDVIVDHKNDSLIICDSKNRRVVRWSPRNGTNGETIISDIDCSHLTMDNNGDLYVSDWLKNEVKRWKIGDKKGTIVAGGNGKGNRLDQLNFPTYLFVNEDHSVYVSDEHNHRVMKWTKGAKDGVIVAGGQNQGNSLIQLSYPQGVTVDPLGNVYVADWGNHRVMCWSKNSEKITIIVGGNGYGNKPNQLYCPTGLSFDRQGNLYVVDYGNHRVQKFVVD
jgi:sugar lactone lactonase YvrE